MPENDYDIDNDGLVDEDPIPAKRDHRIFTIKHEKKEKDEEFDEDEFV